LASSEFWRTLSEKFRTIFDPGSQLYAKWKHPTGDPQDTRWEIGGESSAEERNQFLVLAKFAGSKLVSDSPDPLRAWLNKLKNSRPEYDRDTREYTQADGSGTSFEFGTVREISRASANLCDELELVTMVSVAHPEALPKAPQQERGEAPAVVKRKRTPGTFNSPIAAKRMQEFMDSRGIGQTEFANRANTTDRTIRSFIATGKVRKSILRQIAVAMAISPEDLLKPEEQRNVTGK
jgi:hypothetical protein